MAPLVDGGTNDPNIANEGDHRKTNHDCGVDKARD